MAEDTYTVERSLLIDAPPTRIYDQIADFHHWTSWSPWDGVDPDLRRTCSGAESGTGAVYGWSGNSKADQGRMEITDTTEPSRVQIDLVFEKPWKSRNDTTFPLQQEGSGSRVIWSMTGRKTFMTKVMSIVKSRDKLLGPDFEKGLDDLRRTVEQSSAG